MSQQFDGRVVLVTGGGSEGLESVLQPDANHRVSTLNEHHGEGDDPKLVRPVDEQGHSRSRG